MGGLLPFGAPDAPTPLTITVITVCFNSGATIANTLQSVARQTWPHVEHIVIDGASTDNTLATVAVNSGRVSRLVSEPDKGIYDAMNKGVALATGDVVAFLNADDFYVDNSVLATIAAAIEGEKLDAIYGDVEFFKADQPSRVVRRYDSSRFTPARLGWGWMPAHPGLFVRRAVFERCGAFNASYRIAGDFEFIVRVFGKAGLRHRYWHGVAVCMQMGGVSTSGWRATLRLNREMLRACRENSVPSSWLKLLSRYPLKIWEFIRPYT